METYVKWTVAGAGLVTGAIIIAVIIHKLFGVGICG